MTRIALTGGPGAGKTIISTALAQRWPDRFVRVPEAATQVYEMLRTRWDRLDPAGRRDVQMRIYRLQIEQETRLAAEYPNHTLLVDRGTVDGSSYWPDGPENYWQTLNTTPQRELSRYAAVIWLETAAAAGLYDGAESNPRRHEHPAAAILAGQKVKSVWQSHPCLHCLPTYASIDQKITAVETILRELNVLPGAE